TRCVQARRRLEEWCQRNARRSCCRPCERGYGPIETLLPAGPRPNCSNNKAYMPEYDYESLLVIFSQNAQRYKDVSGLATGQQAERCLFAYLQGPGNLVEGDFGNLRVILGRTISRAGVHEVALGLTEFDRCNTS